MRLKWPLIAVMILIAVAVFAVVALPSLREAAQAYFVHPGQEILATAEGNLLNDGSPCKVIKVRNADGLYVEIFKMLPNGDTQIVDRIQLPDKHDGLFNFQGHVTRLAIADIDNDGKFELLAPSFDNQLVPHLNVFRYNPDLRKFELYQPDK